jgi:hypothetical protein
MAYAEYSGRKAGASAAAAGDKTEGEKEET